MKERLVVIGNGMAGIRTVEELLALAPDHYDITVIGAENYGNYNRILLSPVLAGDKTVDQIMLNSEDWYAENNITLLKGVTVESINRKTRQIITNQDQTIEYDRILIATGSNPIVLPVPGNDLEGVISFRDVYDVEKMKQAAQEFKHAVVIGGGLLGLEAAYGLSQQGMSVTVVHLGDSLMEKQLDDSAAKMLKKSLQERGLHFIMGAETEALIGDGRVKKVRFKDGMEVYADLVVMAVGIRPNTKLAESCGLYCERGVVVNDTLQTYDPRIYSVGECVQHRGSTYGLVAPLFEMAKICANHLAQLGYRYYQGSVTSTKLKVTGIDVFSAGDFHGDDDSEEIVYQDYAKGVYKKLVIKDSRIQGAVLYGDTIDGAWYFQMMREHTDISGFRQNIMHSEGHLGDAGHGGQNTAAKMSDDMQVCDCNGVCKGEIVKAITGKGLFTLDDVKAHTKAAASCGSCTGLVEQILASTVGDYSAPEVKPICKCTDYSHDEVRKVIREQKLVSIPDVFQFLEWREKDGCHVCRPAINYYLISSWPDFVEDDLQSRFINERAHANIQKDGTYSVVPRMWGGMTNPKELRAIADVVDEFNIPEVKVTGGQRLDLFGVQKEQLPAVWKKLNDAGLVSGHAYGKALRTVKTCVGSEWCRFGTQDSTAMGIALEKMTWGSWCPHKVKLAVSGCPRNCAEATIKDFGVVAVESGWELHVGGNGGIKVRVTDLLCRVETPQEVLEYCGAFLQVYREEARYLERTAHWVERVGLTYVKERVLEDAEGRKALYHRFLHSQKMAQKDPWKQRASEGVDSHEFKVMKKVG